MNTPPLLIVEPGGAPRATLLWYHGLHATKETHRPELERFAAAGIRAIGVDAVGHGERALAGVEEFEPILDELVNQTVDEIPSLIDSLQLSRIAVAGVSFGGFITYRAMPRDRRITAAVALLGRPNTALTGAFYPTALLSITAENDVNVRPDIARAFHHQLEPLYRQAPERLAYRELPGAVHMLTGEEWDLSIDATIEWVLRFA
jgi:hypothetical protein